MIITVRTELDDIRRTLHERLVAGVNGKIDMALARELVRLGWTPPPGFSVENADQGER
jgi:hypothetical protein